MRKALPLIAVVLLSCACVCFVPAVSDAQDESNAAQLEAVASVAPIAEAIATPELPAAQPDPASLPQAPRKESSHRVGIGVRAGDLGIGGEVGVRVLRRANVRFGFTGLGVSQNFSKDQITYGARVRLEGAQLTFDYFVFSFLHVSPGLLVYNGTQITGTASAPAGNTITLNHVDYNMVTPLSGSLAVTFRKTAPEVLFGFGNLVPRGRRHWSITSDFGVAFSGAPNAALNLTGTACPTNSPVPICADIATDPTIHANVIAEQANVNDKLKFFKIYPVISVGFGWAF